MPPVSTDTITVVCPCGKKLKAPASAAGKKAKCPSCGNVMKLEASAGGAAPSPSAPPPVPSVPKAGAATARKAAPPPPPPADHADDGGGDLDDLYALAAVEKQARTAGAIDDSPRCPKCFGELPSGAVLCTNCGFDLRSRKQITIQKGDNKPAPKAGGLFGAGGKASAKGGKKDKMAPQGSFLIGVACCAGFATAGALVWFLIGYFTGYSIGFVAMGVGALAGVGMQIGQKGYSKLGGVVAAALTLVAIIVANIAIAVVILAHPGGSDHQTKQEEKLEEQVTKLDTELEKYDERVVVQIEQEHYKAAKAAGKRTSEDEEFDSDESDTKYLKRQVAEKQAVLDKLTAMPKAEYDGLIAKLDEQEEREELISHLTQEELTRRNVSIHQSSYEDHYNASHDIAKKQVDALSLDQVKAQLGPRKQKAEAETKQRMENFKQDMKAKGLDEDGGGSTAVRTGVFLIILLLIFGWKTIWFVILAMFFAYRTASGGVSG
jgi:hypothetical protein